MQINERNRMQKQRRHGRDHHQGERRRPHRDPGGGEGAGGRKSRGRNSTIQALPETQTHQTLGTRRRMAMKIGEDLEMSGIVTYSSEKCALLAVSVWTQ